MNLDTGRAYELKELLRWIFSSGLTPKEGEAQLSEWTAQDRRCRLGSFVKPNRTIRKRLDGNLAIFENPGLTNGPIDGLARRSNARRPARRASGSSGT